VSYRRVAERRDSGWAITAPIDAPVEQGAVDLILEKLAGLKYERDIGAQLDLGAFGLTEPETQAEISSGDRIFGKLLLGTSTPDGSKLYAKLARKESVFTLDSSVKGALDKDIFDLRDKTVIDFSVPDVTRLTVARGGREFVFEKIGDDWQITSPAERRADSAKIRKLLDSIKRARVRNFVEEEADDLAKYGLEPPVAQVKLEFAGKTAALSFGSTAVPEDSGNVYARRNDERQALELSAGILNAMPEQIDEWRDRRLLHFETADITRLHVLSASGSAVVERSADDPDEWTLAKPEPAPADSDKVEELLYYLHSAKVARFIKENERAAAERALERAGAQVKLWLEESEAPLTLSVSESEDQSEIYAWTQPGSEVFAAHKALLDELTGDPARLKDRSALRFEAFDIEKIEISTAKQAFIIERKGVKWGVPSGLDIEDYEVDAFLRDLQELDYATASPKQEDAAYGFDAPVLTIELWTSEAESSLRLVVGSRGVERDTYFALGEDKSVVMEIDGTPMSKWLDKFREL